MFQTKRCIDYFSIFALVVMVFAFTEFHLIVGGGKKGGGPHPMKNNCLVAKLAVTAGRLGAMAASATQI